MKVVLELDLLRVVLPRGVVVFLKGLIPVLLDAELKIPTFLCAEKPEASEIYI